MHTLENVDHSKGNPRPARRVGSVKTKPVAGLECLAETSIGSFRGWKRHDSATGSEDLRSRGRSLGTRYDEIFPDSERSHQKFVFVGTPLSRRERKRRMQTILSARPSGALESVGSGGGSDSELSRYVDGRTTTEEISPQGIVGVFRCFQRRSQIFSCNS
ncbi:MAG: hypothetical protein QOE88_1433 [Verrucomicrobiota bacterium]|nr:hypothetical protein [Verrucomicrobiota bacterium]